MNKRGCKTDQFKYINCVQSDLRCTSLSKKVRVSSSVALTSMASPISRCDEDDEEVLLVGHGDDGGG